MNQLIIPTDKVGIILDDTDIIRGVFKGRGDFVNCIEVIQTAIGEEYCSTPDRVTVKGYEYSSFNNTYTIMIAIASEDEDDEEGDLYEFTIQISPLY